MPEKFLFKKSITNATKIPTCRGLKKYYERLENSHMLGYNKRVTFTFWKLVRTDQGYVVKKYIDIYKEMSVVYQ